MAMLNSELSAVTGAFSYTGKYITHRLLAMGKRVITLTGHPERTPFGDLVPAFPFDFNRPSQLMHSLQGATILYNTYWVRFPREDITFEKAVENTKTLIKAAEEAGVRRLVHISITNASVDSALPYFRGKGLVEEAVIQSKLSYAIIRPTVVFGNEDILMNNIAWLLRRFPLFALPGRGDYRVQPIYVEDVAAIAVQVAREEDNKIIDAAGPEVFIFNELVRLIAEKIHRSPMLLHVPPRLALLSARLLGYWVRDVVLTRDEVRGLMAGLLVSNSTPLGRTPFSQWLEENAHMVGTKYASELSRHYKQTLPGSEGKLK